MTSLVNSVRLVGNVGQLPQVKSFDNGNKVAQVSLATSENYKDKAGKKVEVTEWHTLVFWGKKAELIETYVNKGDKLMVEGKLKYSNYTDKDGVLRYKTEIEVNEFQFMGNTKTKDAKQIAGKEDVLPF